MITDRDLEILRWINRHGFAGAAEVGEKFGMHQKKVYERLGHLTELNLLKHARVLHGRPGVYWLTEKGKEASGTNLNIIKKVALATFEHNLLLVSLANHLEKEKKGANWITAREIMSKRVAGTNSSIERLKLLEIKVPDGLLISSNEIIAVELELSMKSQQRLKKIINTYAREIGQGIYTGVAYYCGNQEIGQMVLELAGETAASGKIYAYRSTDKSKIKAVAKQETSKRKTSSGDFDFSKFH